MLPKIATVFRDFVGDATFARIVTSRLVKYQDQHSVKISKQQRPKINSAQNCSVSHCFCEETEVTHYNKKSPFTLTPRGREHGLEASTRLQLQYEKTSLPSLNSTDLTSHITYSLQSRYRSTNMREFITDFNMNI